MSTTDNRWEFKAIAEKMLAVEGISDYQRGFCHGQIDAADAMSEDLERQDQIAKAAPDMLEALEALLPLAENWYYDVNDTSEPVEQFVKARAAIAKAKGGQL